MLLSTRWMLWIGVVTVGAAGCQADAEPPGPIDAPVCAPTPAPPYPAAIPYRGIHGDAGNSDVIPCITASAYSTDWHALVGLGLTQPNTFSPDGQVIYATTTNPDDSGCRVHAVDIVTGAVTWCATYGGTVTRSAVEVDERGDLYFTEASSVISLSPDGTPRWRSLLAATGDKSDPAWGVHFTPQGHVATVTGSGVVYLLARASGDILAHFDLQKELGFVPPPAGLDIDLTLLFPEAVRANIASVWGAYEQPEDGPSFASFLGTGAFVDNTLAVSSRGRIYVIGGGPTPEQGALMQLHVDGSPDEPVLRAGWHVVTHRHSATSPSVSPGDQWVMISDGSAASNSTDPDSVDARVKVMDIAACDANTDADADPKRCAVAFEERLERGAVPGSPAIDRDGTVYFYEFGLDVSWSPQARDVVAFGPDGLKWEVALPDDRDWTSVVTVTNNHVIGTATRVVPSEYALGGLVFPRTSADALVILSRATGELVYTAPIPDDSAATVTVGPDGALYVGMLGLISVLSTDESPTLGLVRFAPTWEDSQP